MEKIVKLLLPVEISGNGGAMSHTTDVCDSLLPFVKQLNYLTILLFTWFEKFVACSIEPFQTVC